MGRGRRARDCLLSFHMTEEKRGAQFVGEGFTSSQAHVSSLPKEGTANHTITWFSACMHAYVQLLLEIVRAKEV